MKSEQLTELLLQSLEHERGGIDVYENALQCVVNEDLQKEWREYLEQTRKHERKLTDVCQYHSKGWCRELWIESLGMRAVLPPPEERKDVKTAGAARAEQARDQMR